MILIKNVQVFAPKALGKKDVLLAYDKILEIADCIEPWRDDLTVIDECNMLCNEYGLDAISVPCTIAAAMELYQRGYIKEEECAGVPLEWGSTKALVEWTKRMGDPKTELDWLMSSGSARLCEHYGHPEISMSVKKQEMPARPFGRAGSASDKSQQPGQLLEEAAHLLLAGLKAGDKADHRAALILLAPDLPCGQLLQRGEQGVV